jgi:predicted TIM-barrel fold metal-dependent hydrolase
MDTKIWAHSGDSHFLEPNELWNQILPADLAARMPRSERVSETEEIVHVDGKSFRRTMPDLRRQKKGRDGKSMAELHDRAPGAHDIRVRMRDLDNEGIWAEVIYASVGLWETLIADRSLVRTASAAQNEWRACEIHAIAPDRLIPTASVPLLDVQDSVSEVLHAAELGLHAVSIPTGVPDGMEDWNYEYWEPLWSALEETGMVLAVHTGFESGNAVPFRGPGGAVLNYTEACYGGQRITTKLVTSGALDRHPGLKVLISEAGASWVPFLGDRMNEAYRQHGSWVRPVLSRLPREILYKQVWASFQHDESAASALSANGYQNVCFGSDYPHIEGTFGHTQKTLHELFDDVSEEVRTRITTGAIKELFPHVSNPPES